MVFPAKRTPSPAAERMFPPAERILSPAPERSPSPTAEEASVAVVEATPSIVEDAIVSARGDKFEEEAEAGVKSIFDIRPAIKPFANCPSPVEGPIGMLYIKES